MMIDLAQIEGTAYTLGATYLETSVNGDDPQPQGNHYALAAPHGCYPCQGDDRWCVISVRDDDEWRAFCRVIGRAELISDARFTDLQTRRGSRARRHCRRVDASAACGRGYDPYAIRRGACRCGAERRDLLKDPQLRHRNYFSPFADSLIGPFEIPAQWFPVPRLERRTSALTQSTRRRQ